MSAYSRGLDVIRIHSRRWSSLQSDSIFTPYSRARAAFSFIPMEEDFSTAAVPLGRCSARAIHDSSASRKSDLVVGRQCEWKCHAPHSSATRYNHLCLKKSKCFLFFSAQEQSTSYRVMMLLLKASWTYIRNVPVELIIFLAHWYQCVFYRYFVCTRVS